LQTVFLGIGANLGDRRKNIKSAVERIRALKATKVVRISKIISSKPAGGPAQPDFLNGAVKIKTGLPPAKLLRELKNIEKDLGRVKTVRYGPRPIDLDILLYSHRIIQRPGLSIPHPRMFEREFVLKPLLEII